jgi:predicted transcriptional regulator
MSERISDAEHAVMEVLWDEAPLGAADVAERVDPERGWSAKTVKTLLSRLLAKGALIHEEEGRRYLYRPQSPAAISSRTNRASCSIACSAAG